MFDDVLCLSHLRWGFVYQRPNHLMSRWARGHRVFFVEEPVFDAVSPRIELQGVEKNLNVVVPHLPPLSPERAPDEVDGMLRELLDGLVEIERVDRPLLWFYTPMAISWAGHMAARAVVYDCMDELSCFHGAPPILRDRERELFAKADLVFTGGASLYEAKRHHHPRVHAFPSSVDAAHFERARATLPDPFDQRSIPHPRVGFFGVVDERMDRELLRGVAEMLPDVHFVVIGPVAKIDPRSLPRAKNLHWLGPKKYEDLPSYLAGWDLAMMPFAKNEATTYISPTKTLEYLAAGRAVVSTSIRDVVRPYGELGLVRIADDPRSFADAVLEELAARGTPRDAARRAACDAMLAQTSWDRTWSHMRALVDDAVRGREGRHEPREASCSTT